MTPEEIAETTHAANRVLQKAIGDPVAPRWDKASDHQRASVINGVQYALANPDLTPEASHENWLRFKAKDGWVFGDVKDEVNKRHPCMRPFEDLPHADRMKDRLFLGIVRALS